MATLTIDDNLILYDIEAVPHDFMVSVYIASTKEIWTYFDTNNPVPEEQIVSALKAKHPNQVNNVRFFYGTSGYEKIRSLILFPQPEDKRVRAGWNSKRYDFPMLFANYDGKAEDARRISDQIIVHDKRTYELSDSNGDTLDSNGFALYKEYKAIANTLQQIDIAILNEKSSDVDGQKRTPAALKMVSGFAGLEVLDDEITRIDFDRFNDPGFYDNEMDESLKKYINRDGCLTSEGIANMAIYNVQDVLNTGFLFNEPEYKSSYKTKLALIKKYHLESAGLSPSDTSARLSSMILTKGDREKFRDTDKVSFEFPMPEGATVNNEQMQKYLTGKPGHQYLNLLDYLHDTEVIPDVVYTYYNNMAGENLNRKELEIEYKLRNDRQVANGGMSDPYYAEVAGVPGATVLPKIPADKKKNDGSYDNATNGSITIPYFDKNLKAVESYNTFSIGGAHGSTSYNAQEYTFEHPAIVKVNKSNDFDENGNRIVYYSSDNAVKKRTTDTTAWAIDVGSFYPTFLSKLHVYTDAVTGTDTYNEIRLDRLKLKESLPEDTAKYTEEDWAKNKEQKDAKLILNSVSGASNTKSDYALLQLDNKIVSMRCMGNLFIYMIASVYVRVLGARVLSTNTDGIEITFDHLPKDKQPSKEQIEKLSVQLTQKWGFELEPERLNRFVAKDANNRLEWHMEDPDDDGELELVINKVAGKLGKGFNSKYMKGKANRIGLDSKLDHPMAADLATIAYIDEHPGYLNPENKIVEPKFTKTINTPESPEIMTWLVDWLKSYAQGNYHNIEFNPDDWLLFTKGNRSRKFYADGVLLPDNNRYVYSESKGQVITSTMKGSDTKITGWTDNVAHIVNTMADLKAVNPDELDYEAYAKWAYKILLTWVNEDQRKPEGGYQKIKKEEPFNQIDLFENVFDARQEISDDVAKGFKAMPKHNEKTPV